MSGAGAPIVERARTALERVLSCSPSERSAVSSVTDPRAPGTCTSPTASAGSRSQSSHRRPSRRHRRRRGLPGDRAGGGAAEGQGRPDRVGRRKCDFIQGARSGGDLQRERHLHPLGGLGIRRGPGVLRRGDRARDRHPADARRARLAPVARARRPGRLDGRRDRRRKRRSSASRRWRCGPNGSLGRPLRGQQHRHLHLLRKFGPTPEACPAARAWPKKRPLDERQAPAEIAAAAR